MKRIALPFIAALIAFGLAASAHARLEQPDHILYGNVSLFGEPAAPGTVIEMRSVPDGTVLVRYELGRDPRLGDQYALRTPMDTVDPRVDGRVRTGDPVNIFVGSQLATETTIGEPGRAVRLDLDPQNLGTGPAISIDDIEVTEPSSGTNTGLLTVTLNTTSDTVVAIDWATRDAALGDSATGGASCGAGVDYLSDSGTLNIPVGGLEGGIEVTVCSDEEVESDETFEVVLTAADPGVIAKAVGVVTLIEQGSGPEIRVADAWTQVAPSANTEAVFEVSLSSSSDRTVSFDWQTEDDDAVAGTDYLADGGSVSIPPGERNAQFAVTVLPGGEPKPNRSFRVRLSNAVNGRLARDNALGVLVDPAYDPIIDHVEDNLDGENGLVGLADPGAVAVSPDGRHLYVASESGDSVAVLKRNSGSGSLSFNDLIDAQTVGFEGLLLDGPAHIAIAPGGEHVYVSARNDDSIAVFTRDAVTGALEFVENKTDGVLETDTLTIRGLVDVSRLALSADGSHLYATGSADAGTGAVAVFRRDPATGALTFIEGEVNGADDPDDAGGPVIALDRPAGLTVSADGSRVYVASRFGDALLVFERDTDDTSADFGRLSFVTAYRDGLAGITGLDGAADVAVSADGAQVYVVAEQSDTVVLFEHGDNGELSQKRTWAKGDADLPGLGGPQYLVLAPDETELYVTGFADDTLTVFERIVDDQDPSEEVGDLRVRRTVLNGQGSVQNMAGPLAMAASMDDRHLYVAAFEDNNILVFERIWEKVILSDGFESSDSP